MTQPYFTDSNVQKWFDRLGDSIRREAAAAGLFTHNVSKGTVREAIVREVLLRVLPPVCEVGSGQLLYADGIISPQCDVIVFDGRCPRFLSPSGLGVYPAEGVIAIIEVKSILDKSSLKQSLQQCYKMQPESLNIDYGNQAILDPNTVHNILAPKTYIFSYNTQLSHEACRDVIDEFIRESPKTGKMAAYCLPRVICTSSFLGRSIDYIRKVDFEGAEVRDFMRQNGNCKPLFGNFETDRGFGVFAADITLEATSRLSSLDGRLGLRTAPETSLPINAYASEFANVPQSWIFVETDPNDSSIICNLHKVNCDTAAAE